MGFVRCVGVGFVVCLPLAACGGEATPAPVASAPVHASAAAAAAPPPPAVCPDAAGASDFLARHAAAYGAPDALAAALPMTFEGEVEIGGKTGRAWLVQDRGAHRESAKIGGVEETDGIDATGAWTLGSNTGVVERLDGSRGEAVSQRRDAWVAARTYVVEPAVVRDAPTCKDGLVTIAFRRPELGTPSLAFDLASAALVGVTAKRADGVEVTTTYEAFSPPDASDASKIRWPTKSTTRSRSGTPSTTTFTKIERGLACGEPSCLAPPPNRFVLGAAKKARVVRVPFSFLGSELVVRAKLGTRDVSAFLDSGAGITVVDATTPAGAAFVPAVEIEGASATQKVTFGLGELPSIDVGDLHAEQVPTAAVPIPALDGFGSRRPELILGYGFFASRAVRVDYEKNEIAFAEDAADVVAKGARAVPMRVLDGKLVAEGVIDQLASPWTLDTGNDAGLDLYATWAKAHGEPGAQPTVSVTGKFSAGAGETTATMYRAPHQSLGPIAFDGSVVQISDPPDPGLVAGLAGNAIFSRCRAVTFDHDKRTLWLEGTCDRPVPEHRAGWRYEQKKDPAYPDRPWVVAILWPGGAAERAGIRIGDRVLEIGGRPATLDVEPLWKLETQPDGTKLPVVIVRDGKKQTIVIELRSVLR